MKVDKTTFEKLTHLARLEFTAEEAGKVMADMTRMLDFVEKLNEVDTTGVEPLTTMSQEINVLREDELKQPLSREEILPQASEKNAQFFKVPNLLK